MPKPPICELLNLDQRKLPAEVFDRISDRAGRLKEREERARNAALARVGDATRAQYAALLVDAGIADTTLVWHPGGHFDQPDARMIAGFAWLLKKL